MTSANAVVQQMLEKLTAGECLCGERMKGHLGIDPPDKEEAAIRDWSWLEFVETGDVMVWLCPTCAKERNLKR